MKLFIALLAVGLTLVQAAPEADLVTSIPDFGPFNFKVYSGYLTVPGPLSGYDSLMVHYQFQEAQSNPSGSPVVTWHQGGPGGSSLIGLYTEMGYFQVDDNGTHINEYSWNKVANMLYLESPAGSDDPIGFSYCVKDGKPAEVCSWNDVSQAEAYAHTLQAFYKAFPEYKQNELYITGESYAGQYVPNIASFILKNMPDAFNFKGFALGNACWGGTANRVNCNGPNSQQNDIDMYFGKGLVSKPLYEKIQKTCKFPETGPECEVLLGSAFEQVGPHNVYDIYDNCASTAQWLKNSGKTMHWLITYLRNKMNSNEPKSMWHAELKELGGGYDWSCGGIDTMATWMGRDDVRKALHLGSPSPSQFSYSSSGPASITLYPSLIKKLRVLIYNGDADSCVPYKGNEEWTEGLASQGLITEKKAWHPWYVEDKNYIPAGYATTYTVNNSTQDFSFVTIRLAGHMVPQFRPQASLSFFERFLAGKPF